MEWRWHPQQVIAWIILGIDFLIEISIMSWYYAFLSHWVYTLVNLFVYIALTLVICGSGGYATTVDPTDENIRFSRIAKKKGKEMEETDEYEYYCDVCQSYVGDRSKHCGDCNRCVDVFDHHCKWMNNCVGDRNYKAFIVLISSVCVRSIWFVVHLFIFFILSFDKVRGQELPDGVRPYKGPMWYIFHIGFAV